MKVYSTLICLSLLLFASNIKAQRNTVLIIADDLGPDYFGFYENYGDTVDVPNIRALVRKGIRFKNAYANPVCSSTRTGILTGRYSFRTGVGNIVGSTAGSGQLDTAELSLPKLLRNYSSNIATANIGKWHLNNPNPASNLLIPNVMGYQHFEGPFIGALNSYTNWTKYTNGVSSTITTYATTEQVNNAISWIKTVNSSQAFFLWLAFNSPHDPLHLPPADLHNFSNLSGLPADINTNPKSYFKAMIQAMDHEIGRFFDSLQVLNRLDSTEVIFIGDNGNSIRTAQITNFNRAKGTIYDYGTHVPMIIAGPRVISPNRSSDALVNTVDIFATVNELMGNSNWSNQIPASTTIDTKSLMPIIENSSTQIRPWAFCEIFKNITDSADGKAMRNEEFKLMKFDNGVEEFYNLTNDPLEINNLLNLSLTSNEITNYNYLCNEMTTLIGSGSFCNVNVGNMQAVLLNDQVFPNPFTNSIQLSANYLKLDATLYNSFGQLIYKGNKLQNQDFGDLPSGIYFLKINASSTVVKLIKQ
jgi:arylsulfatase A-like enzyme